MLTTTKKNLEKKKIYILVFIPKITSRFMQDLIFFLQKNNFNMKRITKNYAKKDFFFNITNSNFILETHCDINLQKLKEMLFFLKQQTNINGVFFQNQVLNSERVVCSKKQHKLILWKQINNFII